MKKAVIEVFQSIFSLAVFATVTLAIASTTYQLFSPNGGLLTWISRLWESNPTLLVMLGGILLLLKRWLSDRHGSQSTELLLYAAIMLGLYYGFNLLIAA